MGVDRPPGLLQFADDIDFRHWVFGKDQYSTAVNFHDSSLALGDPYASWVDRDGGLRGLPCV